MQANETVTPSTPAPENSPGRVLAGGFLMGVANLVPGVSGGTMILALGLYDSFIGAIARFTSLRWSRATLVFLVLVGLGAVVSILALSGPAVWLVTEHRWIAYSLFIGMTLGGVPDLLRIVRPVGPREGFAALAGFAVMFGVAFGMQSTTLEPTYVVLCVVGALASSSMILPGISGSYLLLIFGLYDVVIGSLRPRDLLDDPTGSLGILVPVGIGVALGIGGLSNLLKWVLARFERPSHAVLLGLLLGSVLGLWPFRDAVHPDLVDKPRRSAIERLVQGEEPATVAEETGVTFAEGEAAELAARYAGATRGDLKLYSLELAPYSPPPLRIGIALGLLALGFGATRLLGKREPA